MDTQNMSATLLAVNCPAIQVPSSLGLKATAYSAGPLAVLPVSNRIPGAANAITPQVNSNAMGQDLTTEVGGASAYCIADGVHKISLSIGSGLQVNVSTGHALVGGLVEIASATSLAVINSPRLWIWLSQTGALNYTTTTTPPNATCVLLGSCVAGGSIVTSVDTSGVLYLRGGSLWRETADSGMPGDTPPSTVAFYNRSNGDDTLWYWDGTEYLSISGSTTSESDIETLTEKIDLLEEANRRLILMLVDHIGFTDLLYDEEIRKTWELAHCLI